MINNKDFITNKMKNVFRPLFRAAVHPHIRKLCKSTKDTFEAYRNKYDGRRCFIIANGPSLRMDDLDRLSELQEISFGMNRIYKLYDRTEWRPTFYLAQDPTVIRANLNEIRDQINYSVVFAKVPGEPKSDIPGAVNYDLDYSNVDKGIPPKFYSGDNCLFADGRSVMHTALQLAVFMGFKKIYLVGADCNYSSDNKSINEGSYPDKRMYEASKVGIPPDIEYFFSAYRAAKNYTEAHGVQIFNATRGGKLEVFERVELDKLIY